MRNSVVTLAAAMSLLAAAGPAFAHAHLLRAEPAAGATVKTAPTLLRLTFSEGLELAFSRVEVSDAHKTSPPLGAASLDPANPKVLIVPLTVPLQPGRYEVDWQATSVDTHRTEGHYSFTIEP